MLRTWQLILLIGTAILCTNCDHYTKSSVPAYPVRVVIDTGVGQFVHFTPTAVNSYIIVNKEGYFLNGKRILPLNATDMYGYGGVVLYINMFGTYDAYDLGCPVCQSTTQPCQVNPPFAICPICGEEYDLGSGTSVPTKGIAKEYLRRLNVSIMHYTDNAKRITISQQL